MESHDSEHRNIAGFKRVLVAKRAELIGRRDPEGIVIERAANSMDELVLANERDLVVERLNREARLLRHISEALERIARGEFGSCTECGETISDKRLAALPWAALCLKCQEAADRKLEQQATDRRTWAALQAA